MTMTPMMTEMAKEAEGLGKKVWARSRKGMDGVRIFTAKMFENLSSDEQSIVKSGWMSWAYGVYGLDTQANEFGERYIVRKDAA